MVIEGDKWPCGLVFSFLTSKDREGYRQVRVGVCTSGVSGSGFKKFGNRIELYEPSSSDHTHLKKRRNPEEVSCPID